MNKIINATPGDNGWIDTGYICNGCGRQEHVGLLPQADDAFLCTSSFDLCDCPCDGSPTEEQRHAMLAAGVALMRAIVRSAQAERITADTVERIDRSKRGYQIAILPGDDPDADAVIVQAGTDRTEADRKLNALSDEHPDCALFLDYTGGTASEFGYGELAARIPYTAVDRYIAHWKRTGH